MAVSFDNVDHDWLMKMLEHRVADERVLRMVKRFLKSGVMEGRETRASEEGVPQGGSISPVLANVYLHYALDLWFEKVYRKSCKGKTRLIRYADDFVVCFASKGDAMRFPAELAERLEKFGLEIEPTKTKVVEFGRDAEAHTRARSERPQTFDFLGFTHGVVLPMSVFTGLNPFNLSAYGLRACWPTLRNEHYCAPPKVSLFGGWLGLPTWASHPLDYIAISRSLRKLHA